MYKYFDLKWSFLGSLAVFEVGSVICGAAPNSKALIVGRAIAGLGGAGLSVGGASIAGFAVPPTKRPLMMGVLGMTYCVAAVMGPLLGGVFTDRASWRWCFYINLPVGGLAGLAFFIFFHLPAVGKPPQIPLTKKLLQMDPVGVSLVMGGITCFILALQYGGNTHPWNSSIVIGLLVGFGLLIVVLVVWEIWLGEYAMMLPRLYKQRSLSTTAPFQTFFMGSYVVLLYYLPIYFQSILGASPIKSGVNNLPLVLAASIFALVGGAVVMKTGRAQQVMFVGSMLSTVAIGLIYTLDVGSSTAKWAGYQIFVGASMAFAIMHGLTVAQAGVGPEDLAAATANVSCKTDPPPPGIQEPSSNDFPFSLPNHWRCIQRLRRPIGLHQPTGLQPPQNGPRGKSRTGGRHRSFRPAPRLSPGRAPWCSKSIYDGPESRVCCGPCVLWGGVSVFAGDSDEEVAES